MKTKRILILFICLSITFSASTCFAERLFSYPEESREFMAAYKKGHFESAYEYADYFVQKTIKSNKDKQNRYIALLERGKVALAAGKYDQCIADLQQAERRFLLIEGTISLTEGFGSIITDDTTQEYEAEMHEKLMISPYSALAYLGKGDFSGAIIERNRTITKINQYIEEKPEERNYLENPFARLLCALMYEMENKLDDAKIEYKKMKWDDEAAQLANKKEKTTDLVILIDTGLSPHKYQVKWGPMPVTSEGKTVSLGFAYASFKPTESEVYKNEISLDDKPIGLANLLYDLEKTVLAQYEKDKAAIIAKLVARFTAKATVQVAAQSAAEKIGNDNPLAGFLLKAAASIVSTVWIAVEQADLRSWLTLPKNIQYLRLNGLTPGEHTIKIDYGCGIQEKRIKLQKNKIEVVYFSIAK